MSKKLYFLGIGGTLIGSLAMLAKELGFEVSGSDDQLYPPMSDLLATAGIEVFEGFEEQQLDPAPEQIIIGNSGLPRGNPAIEYILERGLNYVSGAEWLGETILRDKWVLAVSGTHGKTTTASMLVWILEKAGLNPGFLIGGAPLNFGVSSRLGSDPFFVVEADEYDTSYFDRRSKFVHYRPRTLVINNLEFDHADIFKDITEIKNQFHLLLRTMPGNGLIVAPANSPEIDDLLETGVWTNISRVGNRPPKKITTLETNDLWSATEVEKSTNYFDVELNDSVIGRLEMNNSGEHNRSNALNAIAAARHAGVPPMLAIEALKEFRGVKRRLEIFFEDDHLAIYDDFAHHPTAIRTTLQGLRDQVSSEEIIAIVEPRTHTMSLGTLRHELKTSVSASDKAIFFNNGRMSWDLNELTKDPVVDTQIFDQVDKLVEYILGLPQSAGDKKRHIVVMSNGSFDGLRQKVEDKLKKNK